MRPSYKHSLLWRIAVPPEELEVRNSEGTITFRVDGNAISVTAGVPGTTAVITLTPGGAVFTDDEGDTRVEIHAQDGRILLRAPVEGALGAEAVDTSHGPATLELNGESAAVRAGVPNHPGSVLVTDASGREVIELSGANAEIAVGTDGRFGVLTLKNREGTTKIALNGQSGRVTGESGRFREVISINAAGEPTMQLDGPAGTFRAGAVNQAGRIELRASSGDTTIVFNGQTGNAALGGDGEAGALFVKAPNGQDAIVLNGETAALALGRSGDAGNLFVKNVDGNDAIVFNGATAAAAFGRSSQPGDLFVKNAAGDNTIHWRGEAGEIRLGAAGTPGDIVLQDEEGQNSIHLNGKTGDIVLMNADCAEEFEIDQHHAVEPGTVMAIDDDGKLRPSEQPYDKRVAGVVSGAGVYRPGIVLNHRRSRERRARVALVGRVFCKVDALYGAIAVGDLLTTSATGGHAMKASDAAKTPGAVIGKALQRWSDGRGLIPILVALQ
jgi:hypothetical protein